MISSAKPIKMLGKEAFMILLTLLFSIGLFFGIHKGYRNTFNVSVETVDIYLDTNLDNQLNILHLSDMHLENLSISPNDLYEKCKDYKIDLIALTGDQLERKRNIQPFMEYIKALQQLNAPLGIFVVFGNHDYYLRKNIKIFRDTLVKHGCIVLQNENRTLNLGSVNLNIIGVDDFHSRRSDLNKSFKGLREGINLVLTHDPNAILHMENHSFDYLLSGHFHGGQIHWPKPYHLVKMGKIARMKMIKGLHYYKNKPFYISEGLGQTGVNIRTGSRPEITIHSLIAKDAS